MSETVPSTEKRKRRRKKNKPSKSDMALVEHLKELRKRISLAVLALLIGTIVGFIWYASSPPGIMTLGDIMRGPYCQLPAENRADFTQDGTCRLLATGPFEMILLRMKVGALAGLVMSSPFWLYQIWAFITPGLHKGERRWTIIFVALAVTLFVAGALLAYFIVDHGLQFLVTIGDETQVAALTGERYYNFVLSLIVIFGVSFEVPLIISMLNILDILHYEDIKGKRRIIVVIVFIFAAVMTPGQDPFSMVALAVAVALLVELAFQFCRINDKRKNRKRPEWAGELDDEEASPLDYQPANVEPAQPIRPEATKPSDFDDVL